MGDAFGSALCSGDFNGDGFDDLAIGAPGEDSPGGGIVDGGTVIVLYGSGAGLTFGMASNVLFQSVLPAPDGSESGDRFGAAHVGAAAQQIGRNAYHRIIGRNGNAGLRSRRQART